MHIDRDDSAKRGLIDSKGRKQQMVIINEGTVAIRDTTYGGCSH